MWLLFPGFSSLWSSLNLWIDKSVCPPVCLLVQPSVCVSIFVFRNSLRLTFRNPAYRKILPVHLLLSVYLKVRHVFKQELWKNKSLKAVMFSTAVLRLSVLLEVCGGRDWLTCSLLECCPSKSLFILTKNVQGHVVLGFLGLYVCQSRCLQMLTLVLTPDLCKVWSSCCELMNFSWWDRFCTFWDKSLPIHWAVEQRQLSGLKFENLEVGTIPIQLWYLPWKSKH